MVSLTSSQIPIKFIQLCIASVVVALAVGDASAEILDRMASVARSRLGPGATLRLEVVERRNADRPPFPGLIWMNLDVLTAEGERVGGIEFNAEPFSHAANALDDAALVEHVLDGLIDRDVYPEMIRALIRRQPSLPPRRTGARAPPTSCDALLTSTVPTTQHGRVVYLPEFLTGTDRVAYGIFEFNGRDELEISSVHVAGKFETPAADSRRKGLGTKLVGAALAQFPGTRRVIIREMVDDNAAPWRKAKPSQIPGAIFNIPTYRSLNRMGFTKVTTIFVRNHVLNRPYLPTYGLIVERP